MCQTAVGLIAKALPDVDNAENILKIKKLVTLFIQAMDVGLPSFRSRFYNQLTVSRAGASQWAPLTGSSLLCLKDTQNC